jgi:hypothetical protein
MINVGLIGFGYWGKILHSKLIDLCNVCFISDSKTPFVDKLHGVDWVVVATPDITHYEIVKTCLLSGKNVFCEKPLTLSHKKSDSLFNLAKDNQLKLYVSDVERYKNHKINLLKNNFVKREKVGAGDVSNLLFMLAYHDIYLLFDYIKNFKIKEVRVHSTKENLHFEVNYEEAQIDFLYMLQCEKKTHHINDCNLTNNKDALKEMLTCVLNNKVNFEYNRKAALFTNHFIDSIKDKIFKKGEACLKQY